MTNTDPGAPKYEYDWQNPDKQSFDFGRVLGRSFTGIFANIKPFLIALAIVLIVSIPMSLLSTGQLKELVGDNDVAAMVSNPSYWMWSFAGSIPALFLTLWIQLIVVQTSYADFTKTPQPVSPLTSSLRYVLPMFVIAVIYYVVSMVGAFFLLIGFLFVWPGWALAGPILVHEKKGIFGSMGEAWRLSKGSKRWIFLLLFILSIIAVIIYSVASAFVAVATGVNIFSGDANATLNMSTFQQITLNILVGGAGYFVYAVFASGLTAAYIEVKTIKGGVPTLGEVFS